MPLDREAFPTLEPTDYSSVRNELRSGDVLLCAGSAWFSKLIQRATSSVWSHVAFVMRLDAIDRVMVLESVESIGVRTVPLSKYLRDYDGKGSPYDGGLAIARHANFEQRATPETLTDLGRYAVDLFGYPYDNGEIAKIAARIVRSKLPFSDEEARELEPDREYICSEYVHECYKSIGIDVSHDSRGFVAPADFAGDASIDLVTVLQQRE